MMMTNLYKRAIIVVGENQKVPSYYTSRPEEFDIYLFSKEDDIKWEAEELKKHYKKVIIIEDGNVRGA